MSYRRDSPFTYPEVRWDLIGSTPQVRETPGIARVRDSGDEDRSFRPRTVGFAIDAQRYLLGYRFGWADLMNEARRRATRTGHRQLVYRDGATWIIGSRA